MRITVQNEVQNNKLNQKFIKRLKIAENMPPGVLR